MPSGFSPPYALSTTISPNQQLTYKLCDTLLKVRLIMLDIGNYAVALFARFASSCAISPNQQLIYKLCDTLLKLRLIALICK